MATLSANRKTRQKNAKLEADGVNRQADYQKVARGQMYFSATAMQTISEPYFTEGS